MCVCLSVCVDSSAIETTFPLSNFKTKHIFGILMSLLKFQDHLGHRRCSKLFLFIIYRRRSRPNFFFYLAEMPPNAAIPWRARETSLKAAVLRVYLQLLLGCSLFKMDCTMYMLQRIFGCSLFNSAMGAHCISVTFLFVRI